MPTTAARTRPDAVGVAAVDLAREAAIEVAPPGSVGEHLSATAVADRLVAHTFACTAKGYRGWRWTVTVARAPRARVATVCEVDLVAGEDALLAPQWLPWSDRLRPGDVGPGDVLPRVEADERLEAGFEATGEEDVDQVAIWELGLGRRRVLSRTGREEAATRWDEGDFGPTAPAAVAAEEHCRSCGFLLPMPGVMRQVFGVCTNEWSPADGHVVSLGFGCGAHSETDVDTTPEALPAPVLDEQALDTLRLADEPAPDAAGTDDAGVPAAGESAADAPDQATEGANAAAGGATSVDPERSHEDTEAPDQPTEGADPAAGGSGAAASGPTSDASAASEPRREDAATSAGPERSE